MANIIGLTVARNVMAGSAVRKKGIGNLEKPLRYYGRKVTLILSVSDTTVHGRHFLRAAINNHRTKREDLDFLLKETVRLGVAIADDNRREKHN